jgi:hypothetical protein
MRSLENQQEKNPDFLNAGDFLYELGQDQYVMRPLVNVFPDKYPNLGEGIRFQGSYDDYHNIKIHPHDILLYAEKYINWKNTTGIPFSESKEDLLEKIKIELDKKLFSN